MIKKLRKNIILINILFVGIVILAIFAAVCINNYSTSINDLEHGLEQAIDREFDQKGTKNIAPPPNVLGNKEKKGDRMQLNYYVIAEVDKDGNIIKTYDNNATIDEDTLNSCIDSAIEADKKSGELADYSLFFAKRDDMQGVTKIAFTDTGSVYSSLWNTVLVCLALFAGSLVIIFLISLVLSGFAVKPVTQAWEKQKQFVADASHELKTPLTVILANNNIMMSHKDAAVKDELKWLESTEEEAEHMKKLIDQMLFLAKSDAGNNNIELTDVNVSEIIEGASLYFEPIAFENGIEIKAEISPDIVMRGNALQINQLAHILIDNAVKYAEKKSTVHIGLISKGETVEFFVNNAGNVISKEDIEHIFDRFYRTEKSRTTKGYGLGLSIAQNITQSINGKLIVESNKTNGTTFTAIFKTAKK